MKLRTLAEASIKKGTRVLVRIDADIDTVKGAVTNASAYRLDAALPTLKFLLKKKAVITVMGHRGRPAGKKVAALSLAPVQKYLEKKLKTKLRFLPNTRFDSGEETNDRAYARKLAAEQDVFINESFAAAHRAHASVVGVAKVLPGFAGLHFAAEVEELVRVRDRARGPVALIIGGAKLETKVPVIKQFIKKADIIFVVGAAANAFLDGRHDIGGSHVDPESVYVARTLAQHGHIFVPVDVMVGKKSGAGARAVAAPDEEGVVLCRENEAVYDIGPATVVMMSEMISLAKTIIWNGPAGMFETKPYHLGTERIARLLARAGRRGAHVVAGGGETVTAIVGNSLQRGYAHISTGGGAMLELLAGKELPAIKVLTK